MKNNSKSDKLFSRNNIEGEIMFLSFNVNENGKVSITFDEKPIRPNREDKGKSLLEAVSDFVSLDIETTGLSTEVDEIIEFGAVRYRNNEPVAYYDSLVKPTYPIDDFIESLTGITNEMLEKERPLESVLPEFLSFVGDDIVVGHNINFDINFIYDACINMGLPHFKNDFIDTMRISRRMYKEWKNHRLDTLIEQFGFEKRDIHRGSYDCEITAKCYLKMTADKPRFDEAIIQYNSSKTNFKVSSIKPEEGLINPDSPLYNRVCVFTGTLEHFTRKEAAQLVVNIGGICEDSITKRTNILILGNNDYCKSIKEGKSNKQKRAEKLIADGADLIIVPENEFLDMLCMN